MKTCVFMRPDGEQMHVAMLAPGTFRIRCSQNQEFQESCLSRYGILNSPATPFTQETAVDEKKGRLTTEAGILEIDANGNLSLMTARQAHLVHTCRMTNNKNGGFDLRLTLHPEDRLYGLGDETRDRIQKRGHANTMAVQNVTSYAPIPFLMSSRGWAVLLNTTFVHSIDAGKSDPDVLRMYAQHGTLDFFLFTGEDLADLLQVSTRITGRPALLPQWAYGLNFVCDERGVRARDVLNDAYQFRKEGIPCDMLSLEPGWMEERYDYSTDKKWSQERFHIPEWLPPGGQGTFAGALKNMGFKLGLWLCCDYDLTEYEEQLLQHETAAPECEPSEHDRAAEDLIKDANFDGKTLMDKITQTGEPWFEHLKKFVDDGARSFKLDGALQVLFHPDRKWRNGRDDLEVHNLYPLIYARQMAQGFSDYTGRRPMIFTSCGYTGIQKYAATWAGDTGGEAKPLVSLLNHGLSGHSNTAVDMSVKTPEGIHFGFLQAWSQAFSWFQYNQPWFLGEERFRVFKFYACLRYRLLPYIYAAAHQAHLTGLPVCRAMPLAFPEDDDSDSWIHQYMFGDFLLTGAFSETFHLPPGTWLNYWTNEEYCGPLDILTSSTFPQEMDAAGPLFVRRGAIVPMWPLLNFVGEKSVETIVLDIVPGPDTAFTLREDDGESLDYMEGKVAKTLLSVRASARAVTLDIGPRQGSYDGMTANRNFECMFRRTRPSAVKIDGREVADWHYDASTDVCKCVVRSVSETGAALEVMLA